jgi:hypothetical protein
MRSTPHSASIANGIGHAVNATFVDCATTPMMEAPHRWFSHGKTLLLVTTTALRHRVTP